MKKTTQFICSECGYTSAKWLGKCPSCGQWNTMEEHTAVEEDKKSMGKRLLSFGDDEPVLLNASDNEEYLRSDTGCGELNRVLGGGLVDGSAVLLCGEPGIGKSTLLLQISSTVGEGRPVLYVSGEESRGQIKLRANRLSANYDNLYVLTEANVEKILTHIDKIKPAVVIIDSIQTMYLDRINSAPGSVSQVREGAMCFINKAKSEGVSMILVGHVNKEGAIAGPKVLEHMVDAVLYFEGERRQSVRVIRAAKNRFGSTNEIGVFEMTDKGLCEVPNPSEMLLSGRPVGVSGNCTVCMVEGSRPLLAEIQALVTTTYFPSPKRTSSGYDTNRACLIIAVLEKRLGLRFSSFDAYINVIGGLRIDEPAADLALALALISSIKDIPVPDDIAVMGELGLSGELRAVSGAVMRVKECARLGFRRVMVPALNSEELKEIKDIEIIKVKSVFDAIRIFGN